MNKDLTCNQVSALINFYIEGKLNPRLREYVNMHIAKCPACRKKIEELQKILNTFNAAKSAANVEQDKSSPELLSRLSAYVDNELNFDENIKVKKLTISNPAARKELETMYKFKKVMQSAYEKTKNDTKFDYSKTVLTRMQDESEYSTTYFYRLSAVFVVLILSIIAGFIYLYF